MRRTITQLLASVAYLLVVHPVVATAQSAGPAPEHADVELKYVVYISRHGVRSPTAPPAQYGAYSKAPWPTWDVAPGYLTAHGYLLMKLFGTYDRMQLASTGLLNARGCEDAAKITFYADSDQRTQETGKAIAEGILPGCHASVQFLSEGTNDPLFHFHPDGARLGHSVPAAMTAAISGRIGGTPRNLTEAYRTQLDMMDTLLATCGTAAPSGQKRTSLFDIPATLTSGSGEHLAELRGPLNTASTLAENLLLEYSQGMDAADVGWGCVDGMKLRSLMELHTAATDFTERTPAIARMQASNLLAHVNLAIEQAVTGKAVAGAPGKPTDAALFLIGHDTNITNIAGLLNLTWIIDGRRDDTPPGGALSFELWQDRKTGEFSVQTYYTAQTLEQMRTSVPLSLASPPDRVPVSVPGCSGKMSSCSWTNFAHTLDQAVDLDYVALK